MPRDLDDLRDSFHAIDRVMFHGELAARGVTVRWMRFRANRKTFRYGCYRPQENVVEVNRVLAHDWVPDVVFLSTLFHEGLHATHLVKLGEDWHPPAFREAEDKFPHRVVDRLWREENEHTRLLKARPPK